MKSKLPVYDSESGYDLAASRYDKKESYLNSFEKNKILPLLGDLRGKKILDVGAGTGRLSLPLASAGGKITALDVSAKMLQLLKKKNPRIETVLGDAEKLPFESGSFDLITAAFLIVHLKNPAIFFDQAYRILKDGGLLLVTNINQKDPPKVETKNGDFIIESFYHRPEKIIEDLEELAFGIENEIFVREGETWVNQIVLAKK